MHNEAFYASSIIKRQCLRHNLLCNQTAMKKHERLKQARLNAGFRHASEAARALGVPNPTYLAHENGTRDFDAESTERYARRYGVSPSWILFGQKSKPEPQTNPTLVPSQEEEALDRSSVEAGDPARSQPLDAIPVMGTAAGAIVGKVEGMNIDGPVDYVERPHALRFARDLYAIYVSGDSMSPMHSHGDLRFVHPHRATRPGDTVIVSTQHHENDPGQHYIKILVRQTADTLHCRQLNPEAEFAVPTKFVKSIQRVLTMNEVFGV